MGQVAHIFSSRCGSYLRSFLQLSGHWSIKCSLILLKEHKVRTFSSPLSQHLHTGFGGKSHENGWVWTSVSSKEVHLGIDNATLALKWESGKKWRTSWPLSSKNCRTSTEEAESPEPEQGNQRTFTRGKSTTNTVITSSLGVEELTMEQSLWWATNRWYLLA